MREFEEMLEKGVNKSIAAALCWNSLTFKEKSDMLSASKWRENTITSNTKGENEIYSFLVKKDLQYRDLEQSMRPVCSQATFEAFEWAAVKAERFSEILWSWFRAPEGEPIKTTLWKLLKKRAYDCEKKLLVWEIADGKEKDSVWENLKKKASVEDCRMILEKLLPGSSEEVEIFQLRKKRAKSFSERRSALLNAEIRAEKVDALYVLKESISNL